MKKNLFDIVRGIVPDSENITVSDNRYTDNYFKSGFSCESVFIGFDFISDSDRSSYSAIIKTLDKKKNLIYTVIKCNWYVAGVTVWRISDFSMMSWIEEEKHKAVEVYWKNDHDLRAKGFSDDARATIMRGIHFENVAAFLAKYSKVKKIA